MGARVCVCVCVCVPVIYTLSERVRRVSTKLHATHCIGLKPTASPVLVCCRGVPRAADAALAPEPPVRGEKLLSLVEVALTEGDEKE